MWSLKSGQHCKCQRQITIRYFVLIIRPKFILTWFFSDLLFYFMPWFISLNVVDILYYVKAYFSVFLIEGFLNFSGWELKKNNPLSLILFIIQTWQHILDFQQIWIFKSYLSTHGINLTLSCLPATQQQMLNISAF